MLNPELKLNPKESTIQAMQDRQFRTMAASDKLSMASQMFHLAKTLNPGYFENQARELIKKLKIKYPKIYIY